MKSIVRLIVLFTGLILSVMPVSAKEIVLNVGEAFTCYFQNAGDAGLANQDLGGASNKNWTKEEMDCVKRALAAWDAVIDNKPARRLTVGLYWMDFAAKGRGGSMGGSTVQIVPPQSITPGGNQVFTRPERVWRDGVNLGANKVYDILLCFNCRPGMFYFGAQEKRSAGKSHDFQSVVMHEVGHSLGITSAVRRAMGNGRGAGTVFQQAGRSAMLFTAYDGLMRNAKGERVVEAAVKQMAATGVAVGFKTGEKITVHGSNLTIYNPPVFKGGSSVTHVDKNNILMQSSFMPGSFHRKITDVELTLMKLLGWNVKGKK